MQRSASWLFPAQAHKFARLCHEAASEDETNARGIPTF